MYYKELEQTSYDPWKLSVYYICLGLKVREPLLALPEEGLGIPAV